MHPEPFLYLKVLLICVPVFIAVLCGLHVISLVLQEIRNKRRMFLQDIEYILVKMVRAV